MIRALPTSSLPRCPETLCLELSPAAAFAAPCSPPAAAAAAAAEPRRHGTDPSRENPRRAQCSRVQAAPKERGELLRQRRDDEEEQEEEATSKRNAADEEAMCPDITGSDAPEVVGDEEKQPDKQGRAVVDEGDGERREHEGN